MFRKIITRYCKELIDEPNQDTLDISFLKKKVWHLQEHMRAIELNEWAKDRSKEYEEFRLLHKNIDLLALYDIDYYMKKEFLEDLDYKMNRKRLEDEEEFMLLDTYGADPRWELWVR